MFDQRFETRGNAPPRRATAPYVALGLAAQLDLAHGFYGVLNLSGQTHFLRMVDREHANGRFTIGFALRSSLGFGKRF